MSKRQRNAELNKVLIDLGRSLLQYVGEAWPWTEVEAAEQRADLEALVRRQSAAVGRITELLDERSWPIDFGIYPVEYTDLHYVSLDFLKGQLLRNADEMTDELEVVYDRSNDDPEAHAVLDGVLRDQQYIANKLRELSEAPRSDEIAETSAE